MRLRWLVPLLIFWVISPVFAQQLQRYPGVEQITAVRLRAHLEFIADDLLEGRNTGSRGQNIAALYIAAQLKLWGVKPAGDEGTFFQTFTVGQGPQAVTTQNVVGVIEGSDPSLRQEFVAIGAHYDHLGFDLKLTGDQIYNGADDDGSGTVSVLEIAHAFSLGKRPRRSILLVWHTGEEKGLWGSDYFTKHPTVPLAAIVCQLNIDMIGCSRPVGDNDPRDGKLTGPHEIYTVGSRKLSLELGDVSDSVNGSLYQLSFNPLYDSPTDQERIYYRSDHYNYARFGIPVIFYFDGVHRDYHQVSDEVSKIDFAKMEMVCRTVFATATAVGNLARRPTVDQAIGKQK